MAILSYLDVVLLVLGAPIMLLIGVPVAGYCVAAAVWIVLRAIGVAVDRLATASGDARGQIGLRMAYMFLRLFVLALTIVFLRKAGGKDDGLTALVVIVFAFTIQLGTSAFTRPRSR